MLGASCKYSLGREFNVVRAVLSNIAEPEVQPCGPLPMIGSTLTAKPWTLFWIRAVLSNIAVPQFHKIVHFCTRKSIFANLSANAAPPPATSSTEDSFEFLNRKFVALILKDRKMQESYLSLR